MITQSLDGCQFCGLLPIPRRRDWEGPSLPGSRGSELPRLPGFVRAQVLELLMERRLQIAVVGDSLMHQLWVRFVALMREERTPVDFRIFTHGRYAVRGFLGF